MNAVICNHLVIADDCIEKKRGRALQYSVREQLPGTVLVSAMVYYRNENRNVYSLCSHHILVVVFILVIVVVDLVINDKSHLMGVATIRLTSDAQRRSDVIDEQD
jgi:hypothetical protein